MRVSKLLVFTIFTMLAMFARADIELTLAPSSIDFKPAEVGDTSSDSAIIGIYFDGNGSLNGNANNGNVSSISILNASDAGFVASQSCVGVAFSAASPNQTCSVQVDCTPGALGTITADLEVQFQRLNNSDPDVETVALSCTGVEVGSLAVIPTMPQVALLMLATMLCGIVFVRRARLS